MTGAEKLVVEAANLRLIERDLTLDPDSRFAAARVLDVWEDVGMLVIEEVPGRTLAALMRNVAMPHRGSRMNELASAFASTGAWLRRFHRLDPSGLEPILTDPDGIVAFASSITAHLRDGHDVALDPDVVGARVRAAITGTMPVGRRHGDFAMRNVIVQPDGRIAIIDMPTCWRAPVYIDLATMLVAIRTPWVQMVSQGTAFPARRLDRLEAAFLEGYGHGGVDPTALAAFRLIALLERWAARADRLAGARADAVQRRLLQRHHVGLARPLLAELGNRST